MTTHFFATCPKAMEDILATELKQLAAENVKTTLAGVYFEGSLETAYRICLWSRIANRVLLVLSHFEVHSQEDLYDGIYKINWFEHMKPVDSFAVSFNAKNSEVINNTHFGALKAKDAVVDQMRKKFNKRPDIDTTHPDIRINIYLNQEKATLSLDLSGDSLHRRGYRDINIAAPMKENLAAALLYRSQWLAIAQQGGSLIDPMCGSATLLLEGTMIAADYAPGLQHQHFGFTSWKKHDAELWQTLLDNAEQRKNEGLKKLPTIVGFDQNRQAINAALLHIENAGLQEYIHVERREIKDAIPAESWQKGLLVCNPPYGERLGDTEETALLYRRFGDVLKTHFNHWQAAMIISNPELGFRLGLRSKKPITFFNGALACKLLRFDIDEAQHFTPKTKTSGDRLQHIANYQAKIETVAHEHVQMLANRLKKNIKKHAKQLKKKNIHCYRIYDADLPEYAIAIDVYQGDKTWLNVQEYQAPKSISPEDSNLRLSAAMSIIPKVFNIPKEQVYLKIRSKQKGSEQYNKQADSNHFEIIEEHGARLYVNFEDYLETGLFLDHRPIRLRIQQTAHNTHFLNLFAYTGTASVHAALGGAASTTTIDMSKTYLKWAERNMALNKTPGQHHFIQANCMDWLVTATKNNGNHPRKYDLIFLDPPTFSNSKRMEDTFIIQDDHVELIRNAAQLLSETGILYFSTNFRRFKLDHEALIDLTIKDISAQTIPDDFSRTPKIHYCWEIKHPLI